MQGAPKRWANQLGNEEIAPTNKSADMMTLSLTRAAAAEEWEAPMAEGVFKEDEEKQVVMVIDTPPEQLYCQGISDKQSFFHPHVMSSVVWMEAVNLWRSTKCAEKLQQVGIH